jgi:hypothetical protein
LWKWKRGFAGACEVVGASDEAFSCAPRIEYYEFACVAVWALAYYSLLHSCLFEGVAQGFAYRRFLPFQFV